MQTRRTLTPADIGVAVRAARKVSGLRQYELAGAAGVGLRFIVRPGSRQADGADRQDPCRFWTRSVAPGRHRAASRAASVAARITADVSRILNVWWDGRLVGRLSQNRHGELGFAYSSEWLGAGNATPPISVSLPKRAEPFSRRECGPFFSGLLPEEGQRDAVARLLGVSRGNDFALLDRLGGDVAGALQLLPRGASPAAPLVDVQPQLLEQEELVAVLDALPMRPLLADEEGLRLSLAGAQSKLPVVLVNGEGRIAFPRAGDNPHTEAADFAFPRHS